MAKPLDGVDEYIAAQPEFTRKSLRSVRATLRKALPKAEESIRYNMPTYKLGGETVLHFAGWKQHFSLYPVKRNLANAFKADLAGFELQKGTLRIGYNQGVPAELIGRIARFRVEELALAGKSAKRDVVRNAEDNMRSQTSEGHKPAPKPVVEKKPKAKAR